MTPKADTGPALWRVGYHADPLGFAPLELYDFNHRLAGRAGDGVSLPPLVMQWLINSKTIARQLISPRQVACWVPGLCST